MNPNFIPQCNDCLGGGGVPYIFSLTWMVSGAPILSTGLQIPTTLSLPGSICATETLVAKEEMPFATTGLGRTIGKYLQCP